MKTKWGQELRCLLNNKLDKLLDSSPGVYQKNTTSLLDIHFTISFDSDGKSTSTKPHLRIHQVSILKSPGSQHSVFQLVMTALLRKCQMIHMENLSQYSLQFYSVARSMAKKHSHLKIYSNGMTSSLE